MRFQRNSGGESDRSGSFRSMLDSMLLLDEGVFDRNILKAIFIVGGPGSGKTFIGEKMFGGLGLRSVGADEAYIYLMTGRGLDPGRDAGGDVADRMRKRALDLTRKKKDLLVSGRIGLMIDGTGQDPGRILNLNDELLNLGYDTSMIFVKVSIEQALEQNATRSRRLPEDLVRRIYQKVQDSMDRYLSVFGSDFHIYDNVRVSMVDFKHRIAPVIARMGMKILRRPLRNPIGRAWLDSQLRGASPGLRQLVPALEGDEKELVWLKVPGGGVSRRFQKGWKPKHRRIDRRRKKRCPTCGHMTGPDCPVCKVEESPRTWSKVADGFSFDNGRAHLHRKGKVWVVTISGVDYPINSRKPSFDHADAIVQKASVDVT